MQLADEHGLKSASEMVTVIMLCNGRSISKRQRSDANLTAEDAEIAVRCKSMQSFERSLFPV
jgi:hypothetical protein